MKRHEAREKAFQVLFQLDLNHQEIREEEMNKGENDAFLKNLISGVVEQKSDIDKIISDHLEKWSLSRIATVERTILRIATYEIHFLDEIPVRVSINEALELAHEYGDEQSAKFVNGVLSRITKTK